MGQRDLAGRRRAAAADHAGIADGVMRRAKRPGRQQRLVGLEPAQGTVDARRLQALGRRQRRQDRRQPRASIVLPVPGEPIISTLCAAGGRHHQGPLGELLAADVGEIDVVVVQLGEELVRCREATGSAGSWPERMPTASASVPTP